MIFKLDTQKMISERQTGIEPATFWPDHFLGIELEDRSSTLIYSSSQVSSNIKFEVLR